MPIIQPDEQRRRVRDAPVGRLATLRADGTPRLVPVTFVLVDGLLWSAVDDVKAKRGARLARLADVEADPRAALLVDHYAPDWSTLWWVRVDAVAAVVEARDAGPALGALAAKYPPYRSAPPPGPVLALTPTRWTGWSAT